LQNDEWDAKVELIEGLIEEVPNPYSKHSLK